MSWNHIVLEGYCLCPEEERDKTPKYCSNRTCNIGLHCLDIDENEKRICPYFGFNKARSSVVLTGGDGVSIASEIFSSDDNLSNEEKWLKAEKGWLRKWISIIKNS